MTCVYEVEFGTRAIGADLGELVAVGDRVKIVEFRRRPGGTVLEWESFGEVTGLEVGGDGIVVTFDGTDFGMLVPPARPNVLVSRVKK
jgi:hypothetical protein